MYGQLTTPVGGVVGPDGQPSGTGTGLLKMPVTAVMTHNIGVNSIPEAQEGHWIVRERCERMSGDVYSCAIRVNIPSIFRYPGYPTDCPTL